jgi:hypothetical protein
MVNQESRNRPCLQNPNPRAKQVATASEAGKLLDCATDRLAVRQKAIFVKRRGQWGGDLGGTESKWGGGHTGKVGGRS